MEMNTLHDSDGLKRYSLPPSDINPYVTGLIHKYWDLLAEQYILGNKMIALDWPTKGGNIPRGEKEELTNVSCIYYYNARTLTVYLSGHGYNRGFAFYNADLDRETIKLWPMKDMLYNFKRIYALVQKGVNICSTPVHKPSAHDRAESFQIVEMIEKWRLG